MLKIGDQYILVEDTDNYIKVTTGQIKGIVEYTISEIEFILKDCPVVLDYSGEEVLKKLDVTEDKINKARLLGSTYLFNLFKPYSSTVHMGLLSLFDKYEYIPINNLDIDKDLTQENINLLNKNIASVIDDTHIYHGCYLCKSESVEDDTVYEVIKVPNTEFYLACVFNVD